MLHYKESEHAINRNELAALRIVNLRDSYKKRGLDYDAEMAKLEQEWQKLKEERKAKKIAKLEKGISEAVSADNIVVYISGYSKNNHPLFKVNGKRVTLEVAIGTVNYFNENKLYEQGKNLLADCYDKEILYRCNFTDLEQAKKVTWAFIDKNGNVEGVVQPYVKRKTCLGDVIDFAESKDAEIDASEYAVSVEAQEVAIQAEIEEVNADNDFQNKLNIYRRATKSSIVAVDAVWNYGKLHWEVFEHYHPRATTLRQMSKIPAQGVRGWHRVSKKICGRSA